MIPGTTEPALEISVNGRAQEPVTAPQRQTYWAPDIYGCCHFGSTREEALRKACEANGDEIRKRCR